MRAELKAEAPSSSPPSLKDLMAHVGYLLLRWGQLESKTPPHSPDFPTGLDAIRQLRNTLCHGLLSASADPTSGREPHVRCRTREGETVIYTWSDLDAAIRTLEARIPRGEAR